MDAQLLLTLGVVNIVFFIGYFFGREKGIEMGRVQGIEIGLERGRLEERELQGKKKFFEQVHSDQSKPGLSRN